MPTYRAKERGYHDDVTRMPGAIFTSPVVYNVERKNKDGKTVKVPMPSWLEIYDPGAPPTPDAPPVGEDRNQVIMKAIQELMGEDPEKTKPEFWIGNGSPEVKELERRTELSNITAAERDAGWAAVNRAPSGTVPQV